MKKLKLSVVFITLSIQGHSCDQWSWGSSEQKRKHGPDLIQTKEYGLESWKFCRKKDILITENIINELCLKRRIAQHFSVNKVQNIEVIYSISPVRW